MTLGERIFNYRVTHNIAQRTMDKLLNEPVNTTYRIESGKHNPIKIRQARISRKMDELESEDQ